MFFLKSWLEEYIDLSGISDTELANIVTTKSMEVEEIIKIEDYFQGLVVVGRVTDLSPVISSDKIQAFKADIGHKKINLVSGDKSLREGMLVPIALLGAKLPIGLTIASRKILGHVSEGMACGKSELGLEEGTSLSVWNLEKDLKNTILNQLSDKNSLLGQSICKIFPELFPDDTIFDIKVLPDKIGVTANHLGMAIEIALVFGDLTRLKPAAKSLDFYDPSNLKSELKKFVQLELNPNLKFKDTVGYSNSITFSKPILDENLDKNWALPLQVLQRMHLIGANSVSPLVDISNYLLMDVGQPSHFFSWTKLNSRELNFEIDTLGITQQFKGLGQLQNVNLNPEIIVLKQSSEIDKEIIMLPGISGGQNTMVGDGESEFLLEVANFKAEEVAKNSFNLNYRSEASKVFSSGVPILKIFWFWLKLKKLLPSLQLKIYWLSINKSQIQDLDDFIDQAYESSHKPLKLETAYIQARIGQEIDPQKILEILNLIGKASLDDKIINFQPNLLFQAEQNIEDVIGQIARLNDLSKIKADAPIFKLSLKTDKIYKPWLVLKEYLTKLGFTESVNRPFISAETLNKIGKTETEALKILNPIRSQEPFCRTSLFESLVILAKKNIDSGHNTIDVFEINKIYVPSNQSEKHKLNFTELNLDQKILLGIISTHSMQDLSSLGNHILSKLGQQNLAFTRFEDQFSKNGYGAEMPKITYKIIQINNSTKKKFDIPLTKNLGYLEFNLSLWDKNISPFDFYREDREFPDLKRSLSIFVPKTASFKMVVAQIKELFFKVQPNWEIVISGSERISKENLDILNLDLRFNNPNNTIDGNFADEFEAQIILKLQNSVSEEITRR
jgi:phenylalanyl-tRNA synthetase beta chain